MTDHEATPPPSAWTDQFAALQARFPQARGPVLVALHILTQNPDVAVEDAKAQASLLGTRITAASIAAARRFLAPPPPVRTTLLDSPPVAERPSATREPRRPTPPPEIDTEALIRQVVGKIQGEGSAEAERLRAAVRQAIAILQAAVG